MNVVLASEHRFDRTPDGAVWTQTMFPLCLLDGANWNFFRVCGY